MAPAPFPLRYVPAEDVRAAMPPIEERLALAEQTLAALARPEAAQLPPKIAVHPRPEGSFAHAMPAHLRGAVPAADLVGMKWVAGFPDNAERGLPAISALIALNDPATGLPIAILDGGPITAERTAAVSGVGIRLFAPRVEGRAPRAAIVGAGVQGRSHLAVLGHLLPGVGLVIHDRHAVRADGLAGEARATPGIAGARTAASAREAVDGADVVVTAASFTSPERRQPMPPDWLAPDALVVAVDYATICSAAVARDAGLFLVDQREQFLANRDAGHFDGYPDPAAILGEAILAGTARPSGRVLVTHLGVGLADVIFGAAILQRAAAAGLGTVLPR
jgi:ornithine cyclodeaminase/alanine dehydrogenase-like protein (mu-crystallin family)